MSRLIRVSLVAAMLLAGLASPAAAHNAGHVVLPSGACIHIGSFKSVYPGPDKAIELDLIAETALPLDEIGVSFAAWQGQSPIFPGPCGAS